MNFIPVHYGTVLIDKHNLLLDKNRLLIGIDLGKLLTKIVFLNKKNKNELNDESFSKLHLDYGIFEVDDFPKVLSWLKDQVYIQESVDNLTIPCSGSGCFKYKELIESVFGIKVQLIKDDVSLAGLKFGLDHIGIDGLKAPKVEVNVDKINFESGLMAKVVETMKFRSLYDKESDGIYPCLIVDVGSQSKYTWYDRNGNGKTINSMGFGGTAFKGLMKCLIDINKYDEGTKLAASGDRTKTDTQIKEVLDEDSNCPYGKFPPELPVLSFGKCMDYNISLGTFSKNDAVASLISFIITEILEGIVTISRMIKMKKVFILGNTFISNAFHEEVLKLLSWYPVPGEIEILNFGYSDALGALLTNSVCQ